MTMKEVYWILAVAAAYATYKVMRAHPDANLVSAGNVPAAALPNTSMGTNPTSIVLPSGGVPPL